MPMPYYPYFQQNAPQMGQLPQMQPFQQQNNTRSDFVVVRSEEEARNFPVAFGNTVTFKNESEPYMYTKTMGLSQLDRPVFEKYKLIKEQAQESKAPVKNDLEQIVARIQEENKTIWKEIELLKKKSITKKEDPK